MDDIKIGDLFGKWVVIEGPESIAYPRCDVWLCECVCGACRWVRGPTLTGGSSTQCKSCAAKRPTRLHVRLSISHKLCLRLQQIVRAAVNRCTNPLNIAYGYYGGRGISVYQPWTENTELFVEYLLSLPGHDDSNLWIDRIDNDGNYEPGNLRFVTSSVSSSNTRAKRGRDGRWQQC